MKMTKVFFAFFLSVLVIILIFNCKKETIKTAPTVSVLSVNNITAITATSGGVVTDDGGAAITARGVCWSAGQNPTISSSKTDDGTGTGNFSSSLTGLTQGTTYYIKAYAINSVGTGYSDQSTFATLALSPVLTTSDLTAVASTSATGGGNITNDGGASIMARGVCWSTSQNPTVSDNKTIDGTGSGSFASAIAGLTAGTTYYVRAYATNSIGTSYGNELTMKTLAVLPIIGTTTISSITSTTAASGGNITNDGGSPVTARGACWSTSSMPTISNNKTTDGTGSGSFTSSITGLTAGTTYYVRAYATNSVGTAYGNELTLTTTAILPVLATTPISAITSTSLVSGGNISSNGGATVTARGVCWGTTSSPTISTNKTTDGTGSGSFTSPITGLTAGTTYYVRAYATNSVGTAYGNELTLTTTAILPVLTTTPISAITSTSLVSGGNISSDGGATITTRGLCWGTTSLPTISTNKTTDGTGSGSFTSPVSGLTAGTTYYVRAYATNSVGTTYGNELIMKTLTIPVVSTTSISNIASTSATGGGNITNDGGSPVTARGVCWSTSSLPTISNSKTANGAGIGNFTSSITGLSVETTYYVRAYATNSVGTSYGNVLTITTKITLPDITTPSGYAVSSSSAIGYGEITSDGGSPVTARGVCWSKNQNPTMSDNKTTDGTGTGNFNDLFGGLASGTTYYLRAYATNSVGTAYGNEVTFTTSPNVITTPVSIVTATAATSGGNVTSDGGGITERGICYDTGYFPNTGDSKIVSGSGTGSFTASMTGLTVFTNYYVRAYAINNAGTTYGQEEMLSGDNFVCSGQGWPGAASYNPTKTGIHPIILYSNSLMPPQWKTSAPELAELVVCNMVKNEMVDKQDYGIGPVVLATITRYNVQLDLTIREAKTGNIIAQKSFYSAPPAPFLQSINPISHSDIYGAMNYTDINNWLQGYVVK